MKAVIGDSKQSSAQAKNLARILGKKTMRGRLRLAVKLSAPKYEERWGRTDYARTIVRKSVPGWWSVLTSPTSPDIRQRHMDLSEATGLVAVSDETDSCLPKDDQKWGALLSYFGRDLGVQGVSVANYIT